MLPRAESAQAVAGLHDKYTLELALSGSFKRQAPSEAPTSAGLFFTSREIGEYARPRFGQTSGQPWILIDETERHGPFPVERFHTSSGAGPLAEIVEARVSWEAMNRMASGKSVAGKLHQTESSVSAEQQDGIRAFMAVFEKPAPGE